MADRIAALKEYLESVSALTGIPIFAPELPSKQASSMPSGCIVIAATGGFGDLQGIGLYHQRVDLEVYGPTSNLANELHEKCMAALNVLDDAFHKNVMLCNAELESGAYDDQEQSSNKLGWPCVTSTWGVMTIFD